MQRLFTTYHVFEHFSDLPIQAPTYLTLYLIDLLHVKDPPPNYAPGLVRIRVVADDLLRQS
jgi:hypothetical protein